MASKKITREAEALMVLALTVEKFDLNTEWPYDDRRDLEVKIALSQPQFFNEGPYYEGAPDRIGMFSPEDGSRMIPGNEPRMLVPHYLDNTDHARKLQPEGWHAGTIIQDRWKPEFWYVGLRKPGSDALANAKCDSLAKAWTAAALKAQAFEANKP